MIFCWEGSVKNMSKSKEQTRDSIKGALYGFAIGDAMGATTEFMKKDEIKVKYGTVDDIVGGGWLGLNPGEVTDDTQMSICVMEALMNADGEGSFEELTKENFIKWYKSNPPDVGNQCRLGIERLMIGKPLTTMECIGKCGNGSLMRALPCALVNNYEYNVRQGRLTHPNVHCTLYIHRYTELINELLIEGASKRFYATCLEEPTGYVAYTYNNALFWAAHYDFEKCIINAVNHGGDADTIAAIAGSISGAKHGYHSVPIKWVQKLDPSVCMELENFLDYVIKIRNL